VQHATGGPSWWLTSIYGPSLDTGKPTFLLELHDLCQTRNGMWMINDDFNMIYYAEDKNNDRLNRRCMGQFRHFINDAAFQEIHLNGSVGVFYTGKLWGGQDCTFQFRGGFANYKTHYDLS
jgi:hypothetical protein